MAAQLTRIVPASTPWQTIRMEEVEDGSAAAFIILDQGLPTERSYVVQIFSQVNPDETLIPQTCDQDISALAEQLDAEYKRFG